MAMHVVDARHGRFLCQDCDKFVGRSLLAYGEYGEAEVQTLLHFAPPGSIVIDAGANIGALTVPLAKSVGLSGKVLAFEPQCLMFQMLCGNLALNEIMNVLPFNTALGEQVGVTKVPFIPYGEEFNFGDVRIDGSWGNVVKLDTIDGIGLARLDLLKIDVQGSEKRVLLGAAETIKRLTPVIYVENDQREKSADLLEHLFSQGYEAWWHFPRLFTPDNYFGNSTDIFGRVASINLLCLHRSRAAAPAGLRKVTGPQDWWRAE